MTRVCFFATLPDAGPCDGRLVRCHLLPQQLLRCEVGSGWRKVAADPRSFVWGCGGAVGIGGHHGRLDARGCNPLRIPRHRLPPELEALAAELNLSWYLDREYGDITEGRHYETGTARRHCWDCGTRIEGKPVWRVDEGLREHGTHDSRVPYHKDCAPDAR